MPSGPTAAADTDIRKGVIVDTVDTNLDAAGLRVDQGRGSDDKTSNDNKRQKAPEQPGEGNDDHAAPAMPSGSSECGRLSTERVT